MVTRASLERSVSRPPAADRGPSRGHRADSLVPQGSPQFLGGGVPRCHCLTVMMFDVSPDEQCGSVLALCPISPRGGGWGRADRHTPTPVSKSTVPASGLSVLPPRILMQLSNIINKL